jgi:hypothetical protein
MSRPSSKTRRLDERIGSSASRIPEGSAEPNAEEAVKKSAFNHEVTRNEPS